MDASDSPGPSSPLLVARTAESYMQKAFKKVRSAPKCVSIANEENQPLIDSSSSCDGNRNEVIAQNFSNTADIGENCSISCRVCSGMVDVRGKLNQNVVKCGICNEHSPIKPATDGKKYIRCTCKCLLLCNETSQIVACPRRSCNRIINLNLIENGKFVTIAETNNTRIVCAHCNAIFLFNIKNAQMAECPYCKAISIVSPEIKRNRIIIFAILGITFLVAAVLSTIFHVTLYNEIWMRLVSAGLFFCFFICLVRVIYLCFLKISSVLPKDGDVTNA